MLPLCLRAFELQASKPPMSSHSGVIGGWLPGQLRQCLMHSEVKSGKNSSPQAVACTTTGSYMRVRSLGGPISKACLTRFCRILSQVRTRFAVIANMHRLTPCMRRRKPHLRLIRPPTITQTPGINLLQKLVVASNHRAPNF